MFSTQARSNAMATLTRASFQTAYNIQSRSLHALQTARLFRRCFDSSKSSRTVRERRFPRLKFAFANRMKCAACGAHSFHRPHDPNRQPCVFAGCSPGAFHVCLKNRSASGRAGKIICPYLNPKVCSNDQKEMPLLFFQH